MLVSDLHSPLFLAGWRSATIIMVLRTQEEYSVGTAGRLYRLSVILPFAVHTCAHCIDCLQQSTSRSVTYVQYNTAPWRLTVGRYLTHATVASAPTPLPIRNGQPFSSPHLTSPSFHIHDRDHDEAAITSALAPPSPTHASHDPFLGHQSHRRRGTWPGFAHPISSG